MPKDHWNRPKRPIQWYARRDIDVPEKTQSTYKQRKYLKRLGLDEEISELLTRREASEEISRRRGQSSSDDNGKSDE